MQQHPDTHRSSALFKLSSFSRKINIWYQDTLFYDLPPPFHSYTCPTLSNTYSNIQNYPQALLPEQVFHAMLGSIMQGSVMLVALPIAQIWVVIALKRQGTLENLQRYVYVQRKVFLCFNNTHIYLSLTRLKSLTMSNKFGVLIEITKSIYIKAKTNPLTD